MSSCPYFVIGSNNTNNHNPGGGQQVNPAVTVSMWALGKVTYTEAFVRIAGQMGGGLVAFPLFQAISDHFNLTPFGGPQFSKESDIEAFISEFCATFLLMWAIYIVRLWFFLLVVRLFAMPMTVG
jgi:glycerol uptake facilitator-like aquaporin